MTKQYGLTVKKLEPNEHYAARDQLVLRQRWDDKETTIATRRVIHAGDGREELQLEISIIRFGEKRTTRQDASFCLPKELADDFVKACTVIWETPK